MSGPIFPGWVCPDDVIDATEDIARVMAGAILREFQAGEGVLAPKAEVESIISKIVSANVEAALRMAAKGLRERLEDGDTIDIREAIRIVIELDSKDEDGVG